MLCEMNSGGRIPIKAIVFNPETKECKGVLNINHWMVVGNLKPSSVYDCVLTAINNGVLNGKRSCAYWKSGSECFDSDLHFHNGLKLC